MNFIFIGTLLGSLVTSQHDTMEACKGREAVLKEKGVYGQCVTNNPSGLTISSGGNIICYGGSCGTQR